MTPDKERWAEALQVEKYYGDEGPVHVAGRIRVLAGAGDEAGVQRFREIEGRLDQLRRPTVIAPS